MRQADKGRRLKPCFDLPSGRGRVRGRRSANSTAIKFGRNPDDSKVLFLVYPFLGETSDEAKAKYQRMVASDSFIHAALASVGQITDIDFSQFDLDKPLPRITTHAAQ